MTRDTKLALVVGFALILAVGVLISDHFASGNRGEPEDLAGSAAQNPVIPLVSANDASRAPDRGDSGDVGQGPARRQVADQNRTPPVSGAGEPPESRSEIANAEPITFWQGVTPPPTSGQVTVGDAARGLLPHERDSIMGGSTRLGPDGKPDGKAGPGTSTQQDAKIQTIPLAQLEQTLARNAGRMPSREQPHESGDRWHVVVEGESLWEIADRYYAKGAAWTQIVKANPDRVSDDGVVRIGVRIRLPDPKTIGLTGWAGEAPTSAKAISKPQPPKDTRKDRAKGDGVRTITVRKGETLGQIAQRELGSASRMEEIVRLNADQIDDADEIRAGMVLRLPK